MVKINNQFIDRVWEKGKEKAFKLVGIWVDEKLKWQNHIDSIGKKIVMPRTALVKHLKNYLQKIRNFYTVG